MVRAAFSDNLVYTFAEYNTLYGTTLQKLHVYILIMTWNVLRS